jgi:hypothetical protein
MSIAVVADRFTTLRDEHALQASVVALKGAVLARIPRGELM